jgi:hypothetical protein
MPSMPSTKSTERRTREIWVTCNQCGRKKRLGKECLDCIQFYYHEGGWEPVGGGIGAHRRVKHDPL